DSVACTIGVDSRTAVDYVGAVAAAIGCAILVVSAAELGDVGSGSVPDPLDRIAAGEYLVAAPDLDMISNRAAIRNDVLACATGDGAGDAARIGQPVLAIAEENVVADASAVADRVVARAGADRVADQSRVDQRIVTLAEVDDVGDRPAVGHPVVAVT